MKNKKNLFATTGSKLSKDINGKSIHVCLKWVLIVGQCLGQMPVIGVSNSDPNSLRFSLKSWRFLYSITFCTCAALINIFYLHLLIKNNGADLSKLTEFVFHFNTFIITALFLKLATEWSKLMKKWICVEHSMKSYGYPQHLQRRINVMTIITLSLALLEHLCSKINQIVFVVQCRGSMGFFEFYFRRSIYPKIANLLGYSIWLAIPLQIMNIQLTFAWTFNDLFIMLIGSALAVRFRQVTKRVKTIKKNLKINSSTQIWREIREDYNKLCNLTTDVNDSLSYIIIISFANNLYFVLVQLFNSMRVKENTIDKVYFFFSFGFLILRIVWVSVYGAWIYDESRKPISLLCSVPSEFYNMEILRLMEQIKYNTVALTGKNFFYITRGLILRIAGAIVTYELVLIQYNGSALHENEKKLNQTITC